MRTIRLKLLRLKNWFDAVMNLATHNDSNYKEIEWLKDILEKKHIAAFLKTYPYVKGMILPMQVTPDIIDIAGLRCSIELLEERLLVIENTVNKTHIFDVKKNQRLAKGDKK